MRSDSSDSSENFILLQADSEQQQQHDVLFRTKMSAASDLEVAVEVREDTPTNSDHSSAPMTTTASCTSNRPRDQSAVVTLHINDLELIHQAVDNASSLRMQAAHLSCSQCVSISGEEFQVAPSLFLYIIQSERLCVLISRCFCLFLHLTV